jgi:hypothetical protein
MEVRPEPDESFIGHACIPALRAATMDTDGTLMLAEKASRLAIRIHGPFPGRTASPHISSARISEP